MRRTFSCCAYAAVTASWLSDVRRLGSASPLTSATCLAGCGDLRPLLLDAALLSGAPDSVQAFAQLVHAGRVANDDDFTFCRVAALLMELAKLYYVGPTSVKPLVQFIEMLDSCDLSEAELFEVLRLSRPQMAYAYWLMTGGSRWTLPRMLKVNGNSTSETQSGFVMDYGSGRGDDAAFYLALNLSVIAVEANADTAIHRLRHRNLLVLQKALVGEDSPSLVTFFTCATDPTRSTTNVDLGNYNAWCDDARPTKVETATCGSVLDQIDASNVLMHAKIDVEGADFECLHSVLLRQRVPVTISVEAAIGHGGRADVEESIRYLRALQNAGYSLFKLCRQAMFNPPFWGGELASSGPFGRHASDWRSGLRWRSAREVVGDFAEIARLRKEGSLIAEWFDLHAARRRPPTVQPSA
eukprot:TRINITY_DN49731_c0_g1_i1.p1 TRINITY_DN49731_c0_g1~~TRINITY_DN49731_c0_g1_i1.p1  ORF type:complete len:412 (-),score=56.17 TRINITY_DN49731_c0_g1_i1:43-1278(-)